MKLKNRALLFTAAILAALDSAEADATLSIIATNVGPSSNQALSIDIAGDAFYSAGNSSVYEISAVTRQTTLVATETYGFGISALTADAAGNLFVGTELGGTYSHGAVVELSGANHQTFTDLYNFNFSGDSNFVTLTSGAGNLYATTSPSGGSSGPQIVRLSGLSYNTSASINYVTSYGEGVALGSSGNIFNYGAAAIGNPNRYESIFMLPGTFSANQGQQAVHTFNTSTDTVTPGVPLALDSAGNIYSISGIGGANGLGAILK